MRHQGFGPAFAGDFQAVIKGVRARRELSLFRDGGDEVVACRVPWPLEMTYAKALCGSLMAGDVECAAPPLAVLGADGVYEVFSQAEHVVAAVVLGLACPLRVVDVAALADLKAADCARVTCAQIPDIDGALWESPFFGDWMMARAERGDYDVASVLGWLWAEAGLSASPLLTSKPSADEGRGDLYQTAGGKWVTLDEAKDLFASHVGVFVKSWEASAAPVRANIEGILGGVVDVFEDVRGIARRAVVRGKRVDGLNQSRMEERLLGLALFERFCERVSGSIPVVARRAESSLRLMRQDYRDAAGKTGYDMAKPRARSRLDGAKKQADGSLGVG